MPFLTFSPDGTLLATGTSVTKQITSNSPTREITIQSTFKLWDAKTGHEKATHTESALAFILWLAFSPDGKLLGSVKGGFSSGNEKVTLWNVKSSTDNSRFTRGETFPVKVSRFLALSPDFKLIASEAFPKAKGMVELWDFKTGQENTTIKSSEFDRNGPVAFSPDGTVLAVASTNDTFTLWDVKTGQEKAPLNFDTGSVEFVTFSPDGSLLAWGTNGRIKFWNLKTGREGVSLPEDAVIAAFSPDGTLLVSRSMSRSAKPVYTKLWDLTTGRQIGSTSELQQELALPVAFSPDGTLLASGSWDRTIKLWDIPAIEKAEK
jgi:WD40 repeat protein